MEKQANKEFSIEDFTVDKVGLDNNSNEKVQERNNIKASPETETNLKYRIIARGNETQWNYSYIVNSVADIDIYNTIQLKDSEISIVAKFIIQVINEFMFLLKPKCPVYESLNHSRTELMIALENNTLNKSSIEVVYDFINNQIVNIEYDKDWIFGERIYLVDDDDIMTNYITEMMDDELEVLVQYILEFDRLLQDTFVVSSYISDYAE